MYPKLQMGVYILSPILTQDYFSDYELLFCESNAKTLHFSCFGLRAMRIYGVSVVYFPFMHLFGRPRYVGVVYLYLCAEGK